MKFDERHLVQLAAVIEAGGVTEGAAMIGSSQPAVSRTLGLLEKRVGAPLFIAGRRPLQPTALGRQLAVHGRIILAASRKASETVAGFRTGAAGRVRIGGVPFFMDAVMSGVIASFQAREPAIQFDQSYGHFADLVADLAASQIDLAVTPIGTQEVSAELAIEPLIPARNVVVCGSANPLLAKRKLTKADFLASPWVAPLPGSPLMLDLHNILITLGISELAIRYAGASLHSVVNYVAETPALAIMPLSVAFTLRRENRISALPLAIPQPERMMGLIMRRDTLADPACRKFIDHAYRELQGLGRLIGKYEKSVAWQHGPFLHDEARHGQPAV